jgi:hypothetical protein
MKGVMAGLDIKPDFPEVSCYYYALSNDVSVLHVTRQREISGIFENIPHVQFTVL